MVKNLDSYIPFARKYRPKNFQELKGQEVLTRTLSYCISNKKLSGAILLSGIRGVGKTSSARIIAKTINCTSLKMHEANSKNVAPCEECKNCLSFQNNNHPDVIEIDAASRTGVDDVREIIESSEYRPLLGEYKIFIVDEVHMLSKSAFNALLKLIEEPPPHVIFIFATTEVQKVPMTVLSRCQRYDLKRFSFEEILVLLKQIASSEKLEYEDEALTIIAIKSEGSARDAVAILDQASSYVHNKSNEDNLIDAKSVNKMLGLTQVESILKLIQLIIANNIKEAINLLEEIYMDSSNLEYFIQQVTDFIAHLIKEKTIKAFHNPIYIKYSTQITNILMGMSLSRLSILWQIFSNGSSEIKSSHNELITAQMLIIKAVHSCNMPKIEEILSSDDVQTQNEPNVLNDNVNDDIFDFLKFCHKENEMGIYYFLLNEVEIDQFSNDNCKINCTNKFDKKELLISLLTRWSGREWDILISQKEKINSLKNQLMNEVKNSEDFTIIKNYFPNSDISDIIFKP